MKPFEQWTYADLCDFIAWEYARGIINGQKLSSIVASVHKIHTDWHDMIQARAAQERAK